MRNHPQSKSKPKYKPAKLPKHPTNGQKPQSQAPPLSFDPYNQALITSTDLALLQRTVGNRVAVKVLERLVQRQEDDPLTEGQVVKAIGYYHQRRGQYTETIIKQLQAALGLPETGTVDEDMVQAASRWQAAHPPLWVDGMIGPRTLPALIPSGLAEEASIEQFAGDARSVIEGDWATQTQEERADALLARLMHASPGPTSQKLVKSYRILVAPPAVSPFHYGLFASIKERYPKRHSQTPKRPI